ncbi:MAG: DUF2232 domain-containing protein [Gemmatimonadaceae bacterium]
MTANAAPVRVRKPWRLLAVGLFLFAFAWRVPQLSLMLPVEQPGLLLIPIVTVCAILGWRQGGSVWFAIAGIAVSALVLFQAGNVPGDSFGWMSRGWVLLVAASFGLISIMAPAEPFIPRALSALAVATAVGFSLVLMSPGGFGRVDTIVTTELNRRRDEGITSLREAQEQPAIKEAVAKRPALQSVYEANEQQIEAIPGWSGVLLPALLAIESLIAMSLGWALYHRLGGAAIGPALGSLRDFTFNDQLIWGVAVGASIYLLPAFNEGRNAGLNLLVFFGALYVIRGLGVLAWMRRGRVQTWILIGVAIVAPPIIPAIAFGLGLGDTWLDWRTRMQPKPL